MTRSSEQQKRHNPKDLILRLGGDELIIRQRYQVLSILNDFLLGVLFLVGSIFFLFDPLYTAAVWLFIIASTAFVARPVIRVVHYFHLGRRPDSNWDY